MSNTNQFVPFALGVGANVESPADWAADSVRNLGFQAGKANSIQMNTAWRQSGFVGTMIAQFCADYGPSNVLDDGVIGNLEAQFIAALNMSVGTNQPLVAVGPSTVTNNLIAPPSDAIGFDGQYYFDVGAANLWGPKTGGHWGSTPRLYGNNRLVFMSADTTLVVTNALVFWDTGTWALTLPPPDITQGNTRLTLCNNSTGSQTVNAASGSHIQGGQWPSNESSITLVAGQYIELVSLGAALWVAVSNTNVTYL